MLHNQKGRESNTTPKKDGTAAPPKAGPTRKMRCERRDRGTTQRRRGNSSKSPCGWCCLSPPTLGGAVSPLPSLRWCCWVVLHAFHFCGVLVSEDDAFLPRSLRWRCCPPLSFGLVLPSPFQLGCCCFPRSLLLGCCCLSSSSWVFLH